VIVARASGHHHGPSSPRRLAWAQPEHRSQPPVVERSDGTVAVDADGNRWVGRRPVRASSCEAQEVSKGFNTEKQARYGVHRAEKYWGASRGVWSSADAKRHYFRLCDLRVLPFSLCWILPLLTSPESGRTPMAPAPNQPANRHVAARGPRESDSGPLGATPVNQPRARGPLAQPMRRYSFTVTAVADDCGLATMPGPHLPERDHKALTPC
jgi:hypothetical protein